VIITQFFECWIERDLSNIPLSFRGSRGESPEARGYQLTGGPGFRPARRATGMTEKIYPPFSPTRLTCGQEI
jgi:hypothetical protein